ncbi:hypothetical protein [Amycolatopsis sp. NPDC051071]|uniref:hypothetical protein n=1 Tax=Amycolatopsis sp. NPDC051071 TaxID=3154637 RepID=UPI00344601CE
MWRRRTGQTMLVAVGLLNLVPGTGLVFPERMGAAYGVDVTGADLETLMRHRALLLAVAGGLAVLAAFRSRLRPAAITVNALSLSGFTVIALTTPAVNTELTRVAWADIAGLLVLSCGAVLLGRDRP